MEHRMQNCRRIYYGLNNIEMPDPDLSSYGRQNVSVEICLLTCTRVWDTLFHMRGHVLKFKACNKLVLWVSRVTKIVLLKQI